MCALCFRLTASRRIACDVCLVRNDSISKSSTFACEYSSYSLHYSTTTVRLNEFYCLSHQLVVCSRNLLEIELFTLVEDEHSQRMSQVNVLTENMNKPIVPAPATRARLLSMSTTVNESTASKAAPVAQSDIPETNPFRIEQMRQNRSLSIVSSASTACLLEEPSSSNANNINQIQKSVVDSQTKKMNIFDDVPVVPCPSKAESDSCHTGAHPKNVQQVNGWFSIFVIIIICFPFLTLLIPSHREPELSSYDGRSRIIRDHNGDREFHWNLRSNNVVRSAVVRVPESVEFRNDHAQAVSNSR